MVLLLMKGNSAKFLFRTLCVVFITCLNIKQNLSYAWFLGPHTLGKLILLNKYSSAKQNLGYAWFLGPLTLGKLALLSISLGVKQSQSNIWLLGHILWVN